ncbi:MAG TPA: PorP/SprF family type IX secretion system membrane protein [Bacteroidales bacterium]|nr:PorP/SprF family type IX secretion system membrane protein [Bacteroidales bacterium]HPT13096.1 PorP/SprF family type IX secretion system membrane protein [Bacteroidales bacterium]
MTLKKTLILLLFIASTGLLTAQDTWYGGIASMRSVFNPGYCGASGKTEISLSEYNFLPGGGYRLNSISAAFDSYITNLHGGVSVWLVDDMAGGVINDLRSGFAYSYHFRAGDKTYITAGLTASVIHVGVNSSNVVFPDNIDPFSGQISASGDVVSDNGVTAFDAGTGFTASSGGWYGGFAVTHLTQPYLSDDHQASSRLQRKFTIDTGTNIALGKGDAWLQPSAIMIFQGNSFIGSAGAVINKREILCGISAWFAKGGFAALQPSIGWRTESASIGLTYSYNMVNKDGNIPSTALVRASVTIFLDNVEKRRVVHVIKLPEL